MLVTSRRALALADTAVNRKLYRLMLTFLVAHDRNIES